MPDDGSDSLHDSPPLSAATRLLVTVGFVVVFGGIVLAVLMLRTLVPTVRSDATIAQQRLNSFVSIDLPEKFAPIATLDWQMLYLIPMSGVWIEADAGDSVISIVRLEGAMANKPSVRERALQAVKDQAIGSGTVERTELINDVRGANLNSFVVRNPDGSRSRVVTHNIAVGEAHFLIDYKTPEPEFSEDALRILFKSIKPPSQQ